MHDFSFTWYSNSVYHRLSRTRERTLFPLSVYTKGNTKKADQLHLHQNKHIPNDFWAKDQLTLAVQRSIFWGKRTWALVSHKPKISVETEKGCVLISGRLFGHQLGEALFNFSGFTCCWTHCMMLDLTPQQAWIFHLEAISKETRVVSSSKPQAGLISGDMMLLCYSDKELSAQREHLSWMLPWCDSWFTLRLLGYLFFSLIIKTTKSVLVSHPLDPLLSIR